jgi:tartrate-resistant acid phosphatase type 5
MTPVPEMNRLDASESWNIHEKKAFSTARSVALLMAGFLVFGCQKTGHQPGANQPKVNAFQAPANKEKASVQIVAFGDFGANTNGLRKTMDMYHKNFPNPDLVFLLGDNLYSHISKPSQFSIFFDQVARKSTAPHYAILGNYDYSHNVVQVQLDMNSYDKRWNMPSRYYFKKFERDTFSICAWFIDTETINRRDNENPDLAQLKWLDNSIMSEKNGCTWTIVSGHIPGFVQASGPNMGAFQIHRRLQPILDKHNVDIYLTGHHHNIQHLTKPGVKTHFFIAGKTSQDNHGTPRQAKLGNLVFGSDSEPAILVLDVSANRIHYAFHGGVSRQTIHSGVIQHR